MSNVLIKFIHLDSLPDNGIRDLLDYQERLSSAKSEIKSAEDAIGKELARRYASRAKQLRAADDKDFGQVTIRDNGFVIRADLPKKIEYDQSKLQEAVHAVESWNQDPREFVSLEIKVSEAKYNAWPTSIRSVFEPARTVKAGRETFKIEVDKEGQ